MVTIENVQDYASTPLAGLITDALDKAGYTQETLIYDAQDLGAVQSRVRMLIRASLDGDLPPAPELKAPGDWYQAVEDLIDSAPDSEFRGRQGDLNWEVKRIHKMFERGLLDLTCQLSRGRISRWFCCRRKEFRWTKHHTESLTQGNAPPVFPDGRIKR